MRKLNRRIALAIASIAALAAGAAAWRYYPGSERDTRIYTIGFGSDPPFQFRAADGTPAGVAVEIVKEAARRRGVRLQWVQPVHFGTESIESGETDLWVLLTDLPERHQRLYISEPYLTMERCFLVLKDGGIRAAHDLERSRIAYRSSWSQNPAAGTQASSSNADELYLQGAFPTASPVPLPLDTAGSLVKALKDHVADAVLVNKNVVAAQLLAGGGPEDLDIVNAPSGTISALSLASSFRTQGAAREIRDEISSMTRDGSIGRITEPWGYFQSDSLSIIGQLAGAKDANRRLIEGVLILAVAMLVVGVLCARLRRERNAVRGLSSRLISAQEEERSRIARDLHDDISQGLAVLQMALAQLLRTLPEQENGRGEQVERIVGQVEKLRGGLHRISRSLHPSTLEFTGLTPALRSLCLEVSGASGIAVRLEEEPAPTDAAGDVPPDLALGLYRIAQEALQNAVKHSGAGEVQIRLSRTGAAVELAVRDSGKGIPDGALQAKPTGSGAHPGLGLVSMRERARLMGGTLRIRTSSDNGTVVTASVPLGGRAGAGGAGEPGSAEAIPNHAGAINLLRR